MMKPRRRHPRIVAACQPDHAPDPAGHDGVVERTEAASETAAEHLMDRADRKTRYEIDPPTGLKIRNIVNLTDDLALNLGTRNIRIVAPIGNRSIIGVEVPNKNRRSVVLRDIIESEEFKKTKAKLPLILGKDIAGNIVVEDLTEMPHLLIAGTIGQFRSRKAVLALLLPLVIMNAVSIGYNAWFEKKEDWRIVASHIAREAEGKHGGLVIFLPGYAELPFNYYFKKYDVPVVTQGYPGDEILLHPQPGEVKDLNALLEGLPYVWLVIGDPDTIATALDIPGGAMAYVRNDGGSGVVDKLTQVHVDALRPATTPRYATPAPAPGS